MRIRPPLAIASFGSTWRESMSPEDALHFYGALRRLSEQARRALWLALGGFTAAEAGELLGDTPEAAGRAKRLAIVELQRVLAHDDIMTARAARLAEVRAARERAAVADARARARAREPQPRTVHWCNYEHCPSPMQPLHGSSTKHRACIRAQALATRRARQQVSVDRAEVFGLVMEHDSTNTQPEPYRKASGS